jgi:hypothetical protein
VFVGEETLFPVFQIIDSTLSPGSSGLVRALDSPVPHNVFAASMLTPLPYDASRRPWTCWRRKISLLQTLET